MCYLFFIGCLFLIQSFGIAHSSIDAFAISRTDPFRKYILSEEDPSWVDAVNNGIKKLHDDRNTFLEKQIKSFLEKCLLLEESVKNGTLDPWIAELELERLKTRYQDASEFLGVDDKMFTVFSSQEKSPQQSVNIPGVRAFGVGSSKAATAPEAEQSSAASVSADILVLGPTGVGKSTIVNMLCNQGYSLENLVEPAGVSGSAGSVTEKLTLYQGKTNSCSILDTAGIGDTRRTPRDFGYQMKTMISALNKGVHMVVFALKLQRLSDTERRNIKLLLSLFEKNDLKRAGVLVLTHYEGDLEGRTEGLNNWIGQDQDTVEFLSNFKDVIITNNSRAARLRDPEMRKNCLDRLNENFNSVTDSEPIKIKKGAMDEISKWVETEKEIRIQEELLILLSLLQQQSLRDNDQQP